MSAYVQYNPNPIHQGADWTLTFKIKNPSNGTVVDMSGWTGTCQLRERPGATVVATVTVNVTGAAGIIQLSLTAAQTAAIPATDLVGDCFITKNGAINCLWSGMVSVEPMVTQ